MTSQFLVGGESGLVNKDVVSSLVEEVRSEEVTLVRQTVTKLKDIQWYWINHLSLDVETQVWKNSYVDGDDWKTSPRLTLFVISVLR